MQTYLYFRNHKYLQIIYTIHHFYISRLAADFGKSSPYQFFMRDWKLCKGFHTIPSGGRCTPSSCLRMSHQFVLHLATTCCQSGQIQQGRQPPPCHRVGPMWMKRSALECVVISSKVCPKAMIAIISNPV